ncbi:MAG TPA: ABC transporter permease [Terriglobales bacterium]|nr:ABC transporter permease [Terriglobales bacterium]
MRGILQDVRFSLRQLGKNPGFTCTSVFVLAMGMAASTAIFAFVDAALIKPLPYADPTRLIDVTESVTMIPRANLSYPDYVDWKKQNQVFSSFDAYTGEGYILSSTHGSEPVPGARVTSGFFRTLGVKLLLGRDFYQGEDSPGAAAVVILPYSTWQNRFSGRADVIGQAITLSDTAFTVIGVLPHDFQFAPQGNAQFWTPLQPKGSCEERRSCHGLYGVARLKDGVSIQTARANMQSIARQLEQQYPDDNRDQGAFVMPLSETITKDTRPILLILLGGAGLLFIIACVNVSSLLLVRSEGRMKEIAVRGALGATSKRIVRQFVTESFVLVAASSLVGLIATYELIHVLLGMVSKDVMSRLPFLQGLSLNVRVLGFEGCLGGVAAVLFSLAPMARMQMSKLHEALADSGRSVSGRAWRRLGSNLVVVELAVAMVLLVGAGLLSKSLYRLLHLDLGFEPNGLATLRMVVPEARYGKIPETIALERELVRQISSLPGVQAVAIAGQLPVSFNGNTNWIRFTDRPYGGEHNEVNDRDVSSEYFSTLHANLIRGRYFSDAEDKSKAGVAIINQALANKYFPGQDPLGKKFGDTDLSPDSMREIVGVVEDVHESELDNQTWPTTYVPFNQSIDTDFSLIVRTSQNESALLPTLVAIIHKIDPNIATTNTLTMNQSIGNSQTAYMHRSAAGLVGGFAAMALLLSVVGLYGIIAYSVSQRTREIGVRMALGAQRRSVYQMILKEAVWLTAGGIVLGIFCSLGAGTLLSSLLFSVRSWDVATLSAVAALLGVSALFASYIPARRAAKVEPMVALRYE